MDTDKRRIAKTHHGRRHVVQHAVEEAQLVDPRDPGPPEVLPCDEGGAPLAPPVLLHEEALRLIGADAHRQREGDVLDLKIN